MYTIGNLWKPRGTRAKKIEWKSLTYLHTRCEQPVIYENFPHGNMIFVVGNLRSGSNLHISRINQWLLLGKTAAVESGENSRQFGVWKNPTQLTGLGSFFPAENTLYFAQRCSDEVAGYLLYDKHMRLSEIEFSLFCALEKRKIARGKQRQLLYELFWYW